MQRRAFLQLCAAAACLAASGKPLWAQEPFDFAAPAPGPQFDWAAAAFAWEFSQLAYRDKEQIVEGDIPSLGIPPDQLSAFPGPPGLALHDTQVLAWQRDDCSLIAYRGTEAEQAIDGLREGEYGEEVLDILTDVRFYQRKLGPPHGEALVHSGFFEAVEETWPFVQAILDTGKPVVFIGHSLGGALATYAAFKAKAQQHDVAAVWTFGSPRVGNPAFALAYNEALGNVTFRFANEYDVVARLPVRGFFGLPYLPEYRHVGTPIVLWADGHADGEWDEMTKTIRINEQIISAFLEETSFKPHLVYEPELYARNSANFSAVFTPEAAPPGLIQRLLLGLPGLLDLADPANIEAIRSRYRID